jgi:hypothetical protein
MYVRSELFHRLSQPIIAKIPVARHAAIELLLGRDRPG